MSQSPKEPTTGRFRAASTHTSSLFPSPGPDETVDCRNELLVDSAGFETGFDAALDAGFDISGFGPWKKFKNSSCPESRPRLKPGVPCMLSLIQVAGVETGSLSSGMLKLLCMNVPSLSRSSASGISFLRIASTSKMCGPCRRSLENRRTTTVPSLPLSSAYISVKPMLSTFSPLTAKSRSPRSAFPYAELFSETMLTKTGPSSVALPLLLAKEIPTPANP
mmetsp:Transcript_892/g.2152  ORF Transcript_892/g.2152 Transcript_892/m.2152 type:complete len:221 (-) Transcript_892:933-1595(-)